MVPIESAGGHPTPEAGGPHMHAQTTDTIPEYSWWPDGARERYVRACDCDWCTELEAELDRQRAAAAGETPATEDGDASLAAFTEAETA